MNKHKNKNKQVPSPLERDRVRLYNHSKKLLADTYSPVGIYMKLRDNFPNSILLESSDYHANENSFSFICCQPIATFKIDSPSPTLPEGERASGQDIITEQFPDGSIIKTLITKETSVVEKLQEFASRFEVTDSSPLGRLGGASGLFGYTSYNAVRYFEDVKINSQKKEEKEIPDLIYSFYRYVIVINHFKDELYLLEYTLDGKSTLEDIETIINQRGIARFKFSLLGKEESNLSDAEFVEMVKKGKDECKRGNLFQIVLSREFIQSFQGDEFNLYRALRSVNPSPYLFYFDYGNFKIFGSSPEAQLVVKNNEAQIHPIAGTFRRTGDDNTDAMLAEKLRNDKKEHSEHVMLVDLARNDLSRNCTDVNVKVFAETQYYSHVIHLVSKVMGKLKKNTSSLRIFADTFPAGTLSGAPKHKAMQIIDNCENDSRGYYGGCIGFLGFNGDFNHAIIIRSFLSKNNKLFYRAGAGVVIASQEENELQEVNNKLAALKSAIELAKEI